MCGARAGVGLVLTLFFLLPALAETYISTSSIFELGVSARAMGLGGAFIGLADDEAAAFYNPAGLPQLPELKLSSQFSRPFGSFSYSAFGAAGWGLGGYLLLLDSGLLEGRDLYGNPTGTFRYTETGLILGLGHRIKENLSLGLQVKVYGLAFPTPGFGLSLSPCLLFQREGRTYGIVWRNLLNTPIAYADGHTEPWVSDIAVGIAWRVGDATYLLDFTENLISRGDLSCVRMGVEYSGYRPLILRAGKNRDWSSLGLSVYWRGLRLDFAYLLHHTLPDTYFLSLQIDLKSPGLDFKRGKFPGQSFKKTTGHTEGTET